MRPSTCREALHRRRRADRTGGVEPARRRRRAAMVIAIGWILVALLAPAASLALTTTAGMPHLPALAGRGSAAGPAGPTARPLVARLARPATRPSAGLPPSTRVPPLRPPVAGPLVRAYEEPAGPFGPGHRGVDLAATVGAAVGAPADGRVVFAGSVAGMAWVSIEVGPGMVVTLGPLRGLAVAFGRSVGTGTRVAGLATGHGTAEYPTTLHLSLRVDGIYVDPLPWLTGFGRPRLAPLLEAGGPH
jgi:murein DD-endopeptidase MepM/ murein hydrolase activator NlpD